MIDYQVHLNFKLELDMLVMQKMQNHHICKNIYSPISQTLKSLEILLIEYEFAKPLDIGSTITFFNAWIIMFSLGFSDFSPAY